MRKEIQIMSQCKHKNIVSYYVSFIDESDLWLVMPLLQSGSIVDIINMKYPSGVKNEAVLASILKEVLKGLNYFHNEGRIHRDIKAGNVLMD